MTNADTHAPAIHIKGAREHNLKNLELRLPRGKLVVLTGVSGSGKSSLAFDTIYAEAYRKYMDSLSTGVRELLEQIKRPEVDFIEGLSPVIAIEQRSAGENNPRDTVASMTEVADYARLLWALGGEAFCPKDGGRIERRSLDDCIARLLQEPAGTRMLLLAPYLKAKASILRDELPHLRQRGFQRVRLDGVVRDLDERDLLPSGSGGKELQVDIVVDRVVVAAEQRTRIADSLELAFREGKEKALALVERAGGAWEEIPLSQSYSCSVCGENYPAITPRTFSPNHLDGACNTCGGLGKTLQYSEQLVIPDPAKTVRGGAVKPFRIGSKRLIIRHNALLKQLAEQLPYDPEMPWQDLPQETRQTLLHGAGERLFSFKLQSGNRKPEQMPFKGIFAELDRLSHDTSSNSLRTRLITYQTGTECLACKGQRLSPLALSVKLGGKSYADFLSMDLAEAYTFARSLQAATGKITAMADALRGLTDRLYFLNEVGLEYLTLNREFATLSGGEAQRARLAAQLGMGLTGVLYILDEPSIGLHAHDNEKLIKAILSLRDKGNSVIVVEHDADTMNAADWLVELGPGAGKAGGQLTFQGTPREAKDSKDCRTGGYLAGRYRIDKNALTLRPTNNWLTVYGATEHNLKNVEVAFPCGLLTCVTGVSGSGKSTLVNDILGNAAAFKLNRAKQIPGRHKKIEGLEVFESCVRVDQEPIGRSPRSNPATYTKLFDDLRALYAQTPIAKVRGYGASRFSFNVRGGRCERCQGDGAIKLDMKFLADVYTECPSCEGKRYNRETLEVRFKGYNIAEALALTVDEAAVLFKNIPRIAARLNTLQAVGLGYLQLGQAANTLSGGEAQRLKLSSELSRRNVGQMLYLLDEPTTGLHWDDIQHLMDLLFRLRDQGHTVIIIEHNLDVIRLADWVIDMGPAGGRNGGQVVCAGPVEEIVECAHSLTGISLKKIGPLTRAQRVSAK